MSLWLTGEAAWFAVPGRAEAFHLPLATPLADLLTVVREGGHVTLCTPVRRPPRHSRGRRARGHQDRGGRGLRRGVPRRRRPGARLLAFACHNRTKGKATFRVGASGSGTTRNEGPVELRDYLKVVRRRWRVIFISLLVVVASPRVPHAEDDTLSTSRSRGFRVHHRPVGEPDLPGRHVRDPARQLLRGPREGPGARESGDHAAQPRHDSRRPGEEDHRHRRAGHRDPRGVGHRRRTLAWRSASRRPPRSSSPSS